MRVGIKAKQIGAVTAIVGLAVVMLSAVHVARLARVVLSEGVADTLFSDYAEHRRSARGDEEIGWTLLGETPPWLAVGGGALCLGGVYLTRR